MSGRQHGGQEDRDKNHVVGPEDLVPVDERVECGQPAGRETGLVTPGKASGQDHHQTVEEQRDEARVEEPEQRAARQVERHHHQVCPRQVCVVSQDGVAAVLLPEGGGPGLLRQDRPGVLGGVGALAFEEDVEGEGKLDDAPVLPVGPIRGRAQPDERGAGQDDEERSPESDHPRPDRGAGPENRQGGVGQREQGGQGGQQESDGIAVDRTRRAREERGQPGRGLREPRVVEQAPGQHPRWVEERQVSREEKEEPGDDRGVEGDAPGRGQALSPPDGATGTGDPQEHTRLRTAHSIFRSRPQAGHPKYRPAP